MVLPAARIAASTRASSRHRGTPFRHLRATGERQIHALQFGNERVTPAYPRQRAHLVFEACHVAQHLRVEEVAVLRLARGVARSRRWSR